MTTAERIVAHFEATPAPLCDDCLAEALGLKWRNEAHARARELADALRITRGRGRCTRCGKTKLVSGKGAGEFSGAAIDPPLTPVASRASSVTSRPDGDRPWFWEGRVQEVLVSWLVGERHTIVAVANTATREAGKDIQARRPDGRELWVSVKGYPETSAHVQARHWFAGALFDMILYRSESTEAQLAIGLPDGFSTYLNLAPRVTWLAAATPFRTFWVSEAGEVRVG